MTPIDIGRKAIHRIAQRSDSPQNIMCAGSIFFASRYDVTAMPSVCFYFQVHQPFRLRRYSVFDTDRHYFDDHKNAEICRKVAHKCYLPANRMLLETIKVHEGRFRISYSITGAALDQFQTYMPEVID